MWFLAERQTLITSLVSTVEGRVQDAMKTIVTNLVGGGVGQLLLQVRKQHMGRPLIRPTVAPIRNQKGSSGRRNYSRHLKR